MLFCLRKLNDDDDDDDDDYDALMYNPPIIIFRGSVTIILALIIRTRTVQFVATCRHSPYVHKPAIVKLLLLIITVLNSCLLFYTKRVSTTPTTPSQPIRNDT